MGNRIKMDVMLSFKVPDGLNEKIQRYCQNEGYSVSDFLRLCIESFFQRQEEYAKINTTLRPKITESFLDFLLRARQQSFEAQSRST